MNDDNQAAKDVRTAFSKFGSEIKSKISTALTPHAITADELYLLYAALDRLRARVAELERKDGEWRRVSINQGNELYAQKVQRDKIEAERESLRAKLDEIEQALTECGLPAQLGNPPEPWPARDRILGSYADYLKRHNEACKVDMENWSLRAKLERAKVALIEWAGWSCFKFEEGVENPEYDMFRETVEKTHAVLSELSADDDYISPPGHTIATYKLAKKDAPAQQTQISDASTS